MLRSNYGGAPGPGATRTQRFKEILASTDLQAKIPGGVMLKQGFGVLGKGRVLGQITASGKFGPYAATVSTASASSGSTSIAVSDSSAFIVGDTVIVGSEGSAIAIAAIPDVTHITLASGLTATQNSGSSVKTNDGRQNAVCILDNDQDTTDADIDASAYIAGIFTASALQGLDDAAKIALKLCYFA